MELLASAPPDRLDLDLLFPFGPGEVIHVHGDLDGHAGAGTLAVVSALITEDLDAQLCETGEQTWELWRTDAGY